MSRDTKTNIRFFSPSINHLGTVNRSSRGQGVLGLLCDYSRTRNTFTLLHGLPRFGFPAKAMQGRWQKFLRTYVKMHPSFLSGSTSRSVKAVAGSQRAFRTGSFVPFTILRAWSTGQPIQLNGSRVLTKRINQRQACHDEIHSQV